MLHQFQEFTAGEEHASQFDVCIAGAGVAGITLARELTNAGKRVLLLEGGDIDYTDDSQSLYEGDVVGREYFDLDVARLRFLGGTSNHWAGFCRPLDAFDFEARSEINVSGWPITRDDLDPWLESAAKILDISHDYAEDVIIDDADSNLRRIDVHLSPPVRFRDKYMQELKDNENILTVVNANVVDIGIDTASGSIQNLTIAGYDDSSQRFNVYADVYVLALGGIENARMLLNANSQIAAGIGNEHDLVGRYFMEHIHLDGGLAILNGQLDQMFKSLKAYERVGEAVNFAVTRSFIHASGILNCEMRLADISKGELKPDPNSWKTRIKKMLCSSDSALDLASYFDADFKQQRCLQVHEHADAPPDEYDGIIRISSEQTPNPNSRVLLSEKRDRFGLRGVALDWQLLDLDKATIKKSLLELGRYFAETDIGRLRVPEWVLDDESDIAGMEDGERGADFHHLGTTRMSANPRDGVVDSQCRVFGSNNLYIAGSSVFATGGHVPPTLTIVQLTLRLADHLTKRLS